VLKHEDSERGQVIVLFVMVFTVFLVLAAFAIDQGYWYGRRRVVQKDADLPARAGALELIGDRGDLAGAEASAEEAAQRNGATGAVEATPSEGCDALSLETAPSVEVQVATEAPRFFSGLPLVSDNDEAINVSSRSVACVGSVAKLYVANGDDPDDDDNTLKGVQISLRRDTGGARSCFNAEALVLGAECVIYGTKVGSASRRMAFTDPPSNRCRGDGGVVDDIQQIDDGLTFTCTVNTSGNCGSSADRECINTENINEDENQERVLRSMEDRLDGNTDCASSEGTGPEQSFQNAFGNGDGTPSLAPAPPALGGTASPSHVFVQNDCYDNPRIVVLPIISGGSDGMASRPVRGFATVYITGCYIADNVASPALREDNECDSDDCLDGDDHDHSNLQGGNNDCMNVCPGNSNCNVCGSNSNRLACFVEIRAIPIHMFISEGSLGGISEPSPNAPLTIQTVQ
jgi:hypothetical protein